jgi:Mor family transcriptional regulator
VTTAKAAPNQTPQRRRISGEERARLGKEVVEKYNAGASIRQLAKQTRWSYGLIRRMLIESGVTFRPPGGNALRARQAQRLKAKARREAITTSGVTVAEDLVERYHDGASMAALARRTGRSQGFIHRVLAEQGVAFRHLCGTKDRRIVGDERATLGKQLKKRYDAGESVRQLERSTGRSYGFIYRVLAEQRVAFRSRGGSHSPGAGRPKTSKA